MRGTIASAILGVVAACNVDSGPATNPFAGTSAGPGDGSATNTEITTGALPTSGADGGGSASSDGAMSTTGAPPATDDGPVGTSDTTAGGGDTTAGGESTGRTSDCDPILVEVLYDLPGSDNGLEWIRLYNPCMDPIALGGYSLGWGGTDYTYGVLDLSGTIDPGGCFTVGGPTSIASNGSPTLDQAVDLSPDVQNSGATADGIALFAGPSISIGGATPVDAVIYGDSNDSGLLDADGMTPPPHVGDAPEGNALVRTSLDPTWQIALPDPSLCPPF